MNNHPKLTYFYVWTCDIIALLIIIFSIFHLEIYSVETWVHFLIWASIIAIARLGVLDLIGLNVGVGLQSAVELAALVIIPFPLYCLSIIISFILIVIKRIKSNHPEPFLGPDFNAANVIISGLCAVSVYSYLLVLFEPIPFAETLAILPTALIYSAMNLLLLSSLLSIDLNKPLREVGSLDNDALIGEGIMIAGGALVGRIYQLDPSLIVVMLIPMALLNKSLNKINESKLAYIDGKTGLYNYRYFDETIAQQFKKAKETKKPLSIIFGDMDHLREVNNTYGHLNGDRALEAVAKVFKDTGGKGTIASRFGGEEFVLIAPGLSKRKTARLAEKIRRNIEKKEITLDNGEKIHATISLGVASYPEDAKSIEKLITYADEAVYAAKHAGRNKVRIHKPNLPKT
jgi:diguanylate cyclase